MVLSVSTGHVEKERLNGFGSRDFKNVALSASVSLKNVAVEAANGLLQLVTENGLLKQPKLLSSLQLANAGGAVVVSKLNDASQFSS